MFRDPYEGDGFKLQFSFRYNFSTMIGGGSHEQHAFASGALPSPPSALPMVFPGVEDAARLRSTYSADCRTVSRRVKCINTLNADGTTVAKVEIRLQVKEGLCEWH